jgi:diaminopimelate decarboxylase
VKERPGLRKWILTDGGIGTVTMPTFYECHDVLLCNDIHRPVTEKVTLIGPVCFASDAIYRNKRMPALNPGEVIAIMDSGAYFTAWESSFGFPHPPVVVVAAGRHRLLRRRETFQDMTARDRLDQAGKEEA